MSCNEILHFIWTKRLLVLEERKQIYIPDNMNYTTWDIAFLENIFQPPISEMIWPEYIWLYIWLHIDFSS